MRKKKFIAIVMTIVIVLAMSFVTGCTKETQTQGGGTGGQTVEPVPQKVKCMEYYVNDDYIATGDEGYEHFIVVESEIVITSPDAISTEEVMLMTLEKLKDVPEDVTSATITTAVNSKFIFDSVKVNGSTAEVYLLNAAELTGGDLEERMAVGQIVSTLVNTFDEIENVLFFADGQPITTLMGHLDTSQPIGLSDL